MFALNCPDLDRTVLVFDHSVVARTRTHHGTVVEFRCACGADGVGLEDPGAAPGRMLYHLAEPEAAWRLCPRSRAGNLGADESAAVSRTVDVEAAV
jgi:hypothetical protein